MPRRRDAGDGAIIERPDGRFEGRIWQKDRKGKRKRISVYGKTRTEVKRKLAQVKRDAEEGKLPTDTQTLRGWIVFWLTTQEASGSLGASTLVGYRENCVNHILPALGDIPLSHLDGEMIQDWINNDLAINYKPRTIRKIHVVLSSALEAAVRIKKIPYNPAHGVTMPQVRRYNGPVVDVQQASALVEAAIDTPLECLIIIALVTGMRKGEILALTWDAVDLDQGVIQVKSNLAYLPDKDRKYRYVVGEPKSEAGIRPIYLPSFAIDALRAHRIRQNKQRLKCGPVWKDLNTVFTTRDGNYYSKKVLFYQFKALLKTAGLPEDMHTMHFHDLRHSAATILFEMEVNPKAVQRQLGHANVKTTLELYGKVTKKMEQGATDKIDAAYRKELG